MSDKKDARTETTTHKDPSDGFIRTALIVRPKGETGSVDVVDSEGKRLAQINLFAYEDGSLIVDVIDVEGRFQERRALTFIGGQRHVLEADKLVSVDFRNK